MSNIVCAACRNDLHRDRDFVEFQVRGPSSSPIVICSPRLYGRARAAVKAYSIGAGKHALCRDVRACKIMQRINSLEVQEFEYG